MALAGTGLFKQTDNTHLEKFSFSFNKYRNCDLSYNIIIGNQKYSSYLSDYTNDLETIRHDLESFVFHKRTILELFYEDSPTIVTLKTERLLNPQTEKEEGTGFAWEEVLSISIKPNSFQSEKYKEINGYCEVKSGIEAIYSAFLQCALMLKENEDEDDYWPERKDFYNIIKSPIIEDFISGREYNPYAPRRRYAPIDIVMTINPDIFSVTSNDFSGVCNDIFSDTFRVFDCEDNTIQEIIVSGIEDWLNEFKRASDTAKTASNFDLEKWHQRGLNFAQTIRDRMVNNCDLWYYAPFEDYLYPKLILKK